MTAKDRKPTEMLVRAGDDLPDETIIWRYFTFERFLQVLDTHSIWFSRPFKFDDRWEGLFPPSYVRRTRQYAQANGIPYEDFDQKFRKRLLRHRYGHFVNCWHISDHESDAMWRLYARTCKLGTEAKPGIAIQSTIGDVTECLRPHNWGPVIYYDPSHEVLSASIFGPNDIRFKREVFAWEREYRFWFDDDDIIERIDAGEDVDEKSLSTGKAAGISDMPRLIKRLVVAPGASDEFLEEVRTTCAGHKRRWLGNIIERSYSDRMWEDFTR